jgi:hypothetical protein
LKRRTRVARAFARAAALSLLGSLASACGLLIGLEDRLLDDGSATGSGPGGVCVTPGDCPVAGNACFVRVCVSSTCGLIDAPEGTLVASQAEGDCRRVECDPTGVPVEIVDPEDPFDDGRLCTDDLCDGLKPTHKPAAIGKGCGGGRICNDVGSCVECLDDDDCGALLVCDLYKCVPDTCKNGITDGSETDIDCGGNCNPCADGKVCGDWQDCDSKVCTDAICQVPTCTDTVKNGTESDKDCGGFACPKCPEGNGCGANEDCVSGVCGGGAPKECQAPSCTDGVHNGDELAVDCGGSSCQAGSCDDGEPCGTAIDCQSGVCTGLVCQTPTCSDGVKNSTEEGTDCGGPCPACS